MPSASKPQDERWLMQLTAIPTAAGREQRAIHWVKSWVKQRSNLKLTEDRAGNLFITVRTSSRKKAARTPKPLYFTAHLDHPAFVVIGIASDHTIELEFRGGVNDPYFERARIDIIHQHDHSHPATIIALDSKATPFKRIIAQPDQPSDEIDLGDIARWRFEHHPQLPYVSNGLFHTHACDDLAALAAALAALDELRRDPKMSHVGVLLTRAEEIGFIGALAACKHKSIPKSARLICLENSRSFPDSPIGAGAILRVGDRSSVFEPTLTNCISDVLTDYANRNPPFKWQRKLMPGGTCEATAFSAHGYTSTCLCLPLGNYHNMAEIDEVAQGKRPAMTAPEFISLDDYHSLIQMLIICAREMDSASIPPLQTRLNNLLREHEAILKEGQDQ